MIVTGCQTPPPPTLPHSPVAAFDPVSAAPQDQTPPTTIRPIPPPPDALARQTANYVQRLDPAGKTHAPDNSGINWIDPQELKLNGSPSAQPAPQIVPLVRPVVDTTPSKLNANTTLAMTNTARTASDGGTQPGGSTESNTPIEVQIEPRGPAAGRTAPPPIVGDALEQQLAQHVREYPHDVWAQFDYQVLQFIHDQPVPQVQPLTPMPIEDRELISAVMDGLSNFRNTLRSDNNLLLSRKVRPLIDMADRLRAQADLTIPTLTLCTKVDGFGVYVPIEPARFQTGREQPAIIYCEVENFASQVDEHKSWETKLTQEAVLYTETGLPVWQDKTKSIVDHSRNRRHDFFITKVIKFPATLTPGHYLLKVTVVDQNANRVAEATMPVQMAAP